MPCFAAYGAPACPVRPQREKAKTSPHGWTAEQACLDMGSRWTTDLDTGSLVGITVP